jgi:choline dehydrogenase
LRPALSRPNLKLITGALTERIVVEGGRAVRVEFTRGNHASTATAKGEIILAAGAVNTPKLLELSGIGRGDILQALGVELTKELSGVGENLQDHLQLRTIYRLGKGRTLNQRAGSLLGKAAIGLEYALFQSGPLSMAPSQFGIFTKSDPRLETPDLEYHVQPLSTDKLGDPLHPFPAVTASVCNLRPESRGSIHMAEANANAHPLIRPNYLSAPNDRAVAVRALKLTRELMKTKAIAPFAPTELLPGEEFQSDEELAAKAGDIGTTIFHPVGTCKMGSDPQAVVDARLNVHGIGALRVVDASIMPTITSGNTNSPVIMIAEKASQMILADAR